MSGPFRLNVGGLIDRTRVLRFAFDKQSLTGFGGDTLASALLGAGVRVVGRSLKFHRPRGILTAGIEEPNALLTVGAGARAEPSVRATVQPLFEGLIASSQNCWPSVKFDVGRLNDFFHPLFPAGFYNKTFIWPSWHVFEGTIRRIAGLGVAPSGPDPDRYEWRNAHCDVLVIGGGPAGMLTAYLAGRSGARVILIERDDKLGASLNGTRDALDTTALRDVLPELAAVPSVRVILRTTAVGSYDHNLITAVESASPDDATVRYRQRWWRIRAKRIVLACGAIEQPLAFPYNDRPGIMLAGAVSHYLNRYAVAAGRRVIIATNNDSAYRAAVDLRSAGIEVPCLLDTRANTDERLIDEAKAAGITVYRRAHIVSTEGASEIRSLEFVSEGRSSRPTRVNCDAVGMSGGWNPTSHLYCQAGGRLAWDPFHSCLVPDGRLKSIHATGANVAQFDLASALDHARTTARTVVESLDMRFHDDAQWLSGVVSKRVLGICQTGDLGYLAAEKRDRTWLDFQHDVTVSDIDLAVRENLLSVEHVKRYTTVGMSVDQGKTSNLNALAVLAERTGRAIPEVGTTTFRPMFTPVTLGTIAGGRNGRFYRPSRLLPAHREHMSLGAHLEDYGSWLRAACYPRQQELPGAAIEREVGAVRSGVGIFDASPLGKFLVRGPDAAEFLNRIYATRVDDLKPGRVRYGLMLNERGIVIDDGVCARLSANELWVNTTGSGASRIGAWLDEWLQGEWPNLQVVVTDVTSAYATINLAGPRARDVLSLLPSDIDVSREAFPHMHARQGHLCGVPCRILRVSFTGELSYEISVPADYGVGLWERLMAEGERFGITPFGVESVLVMRTEKGYLHVGADTDGTTVPADIGFGLVTSRKPGDFVGRRSLDLPENVRADRMHLVGLKCVGPSDAFVAGAHLLDAARTQVAQETAGYLTSAVASPSVGGHVGLGLLKNGRARMGETLHIFESGRQTTAQVVSTAHYDPAGKHLHA